MSEKALDEAALGSWLEANVEGFTGPFTPTKFPSGQSNPTYKITAASGEYVLRRKPFGQLLPSAHAVDREYACSPRSTRSNFRCRSRWRFAKIRRSSAPFSM